MLVGAGGRLGGRARVGGRGARGRGLCLLGLGRRRGRL